MRFFSHLPYWRQFVLVLVILLLIFGTVQIRWQIAFTLLAVFLSDQTCNAIKAIVKRNRPDRKGNPKGNFWKRLGFYSFPSSHAANMFTVAILLSHWYSYLIVPLFLLAGLVSFSRIYLNNHYPSDIIIGGIIGLTYGYLIIQFV